MDGSCTDLPAAARVEEIRSPRDCATSLAAFTRRAYTQEGFGQESNDVHTQCKPKCVKQRQHRGVHTTALDAILGHPRYVTHLSQKQFMRSTHIHTYLMYLYAHTYLMHLYVHTYLMYLYAHTYLMYLYAHTYCSLMYLYTLLLTNQPT